MSKVVETRGGCLAALCVEDAVYEVLMPGDWWWPECAEHTAEMRMHLPEYVQAVRLAPAPVVPSDGSGQR